MAIVKLARAYLAAFISDREALLKRLQQMKDIHFADLNAKQQDVVFAEFADRVIPDKPGLILSGAREEIDRIQLAIDGLEKRLPPQGLLAGLNSALPQMSFDELDEKASSIDLGAVTEAIRENLKQVDHLKEQVAVLKDKRRELIPYQKLDVSLADLKGMQQVAFALGTIPKNKEADLRKDLADFEQVYFEPLASDDKDFYFLLLFAKEAAELVQTLLHQYSFAAKNLPGETTPTQLSRSYLADIDRLTAQLEEVEADLDQQTEQHLPTLKLKLEWLKNLIVRQEARFRLIAGDHVFFLEIYFPADLQEQVDQCLAEVMEKPYYVQMATVERDDAQVEDVPILLENGGLVQPFENIVEMFSLPRYDEIDPTPVVAPWYSLCFGFMLGDFGYALVLFLLTTFVLKAFRLKPALRSKVKFFQILSVPSMLIGYLFGGFFALPMPASWPLCGIVSPTDSPNDILMVSLFFGVAMLFFGLGVKGYMCLRDRDYLALVADVISWYLVVVSAGVVLLTDWTGLPRTLAMVGLVSGILLILLFSARDEKGWGARLGWGAYNVYGATGWIGDIVSFARLAALAMSGGFIGYAINLIVGNLAHGPIGILMGIVIVLIFHPFNIFLSSLSAYVHGLRLIYVELFGKFYSGGGTAFQPFRADSTYIDIK